jgi:type III restriction enzyme
MQHFFPPHKEFPQKELIPGSEHSLYNLIQIDSDVEERFVKSRLQIDDKKGNIVSYFKFPSDFKIHIPKVILNYNPDWGIIRIDKAGNKTLHLVRETKGNIDADTLRFPNERRKILCAQKHFKALGVSYRQITDKDEEWWLDDTE